MAFVPDGFDNKLISMDAIISTGATSSKPETGFRVLMRPGLVPAGFGRRKDSTVRPATSTTRYGPVFTRPCAVVLTPLRHKDCFVGPP